MSISGQKRKNIIIIIHRNKNLKKTQIICATVERSEVWDEEKN